MRQNRIKHKLANGEVTTVIEGFHSPDILDFIGSLGCCDGAWIETEHGPYDFADIPDMTRACDLWGMTPVVRVNQITPGVIYRTLDVGAQGIIMPHVNNADEARQVVDAARFHPLGQRGMFGSRQGYGDPDYFQKANDETLVVIMIEDIAAVDQLDDILKVDGIDVFFVAPGDLSQSMGLLGQPFHPDVTAVMDSVIERTIAAGRTPGTLATLDTIDHYVEKGAKFIMTGWPAWLTSGAKDFLATIPRS